MSTAQAPPVKPTKQETFVEGQMGRAKARIRTLDTTASLLGLLIGFLVYGVGMMVLHHFLVLPPLLRQVALALFFIGAGIYLTFTLILPLRRQVNPYYAAVCVEHTLPGAKNSLVNWLDLRDRNLAPAIRGAVGQRAAKDLSQASLDQAFSSRRLYWLGGGTLIMFALLVMLFAYMRPGRFFSLLREAFVPFVEAPVSTRTQLRMVLPLEGNAVVPMDQSINFAVQVGGREPRAEDADAIKLVFQYTPDEPVQERPFTRGDTDGQWVLTFPAFEVRNGFWYQVKGGDAVIPNREAFYHIKARSGPMFTTCEVTYTPRSYTRLPAEKRTDWNLEGLRGTAVSIVARTNRTVRDGKLLLDGETAPILGQRIQGDPEAIQFKLVLEKDSTYRVRFVSEENEYSGDSLPYTIKVTQDQPPAVELKTPAKTMKVPANGVLQLTGAATDDFGLTEMTLKMQNGAAKEIRPQPYRAGKFQFEDGGNPRQHDYQDFIAIDQLRYANGQPMNAKPGDVIDYWLEASDNCDYPKANTGKSKQFRIEVIAPETPQQQQDDKKKADQEQKKHEQQQDQNDAKQNQERKEQAKQENQQQDNPGQKPNPGDRKEPQQPEQNPKDQDLENKLNKLQNEADKKQGEAKPEGDKKQGESKDAGKNENQANEKPEENQNKPGDNKPEDGKNGPDKQGQGKEDKGDKSKDGNNGEKKQQPGKDPNKGDNQGAGDKNNQDKAGQQKPQPKEGEKNNKPEQGDPQKGGAKPDQGGDKGGDQKSGEKGDSKSPPKDGGKGGQEAGASKPSSKDPNGGGDNQGGEKNKPSDKAGQSHGDKSPEGKEQPGNGHPDPKAPGNAAKDDKPATGEAKPDTPSPKGDSKGTQNANDKPGDAHGSSDSNDPKGAQPGNKPAEPKKQPSAQQAKDASTAKGNEGQKSGDTASGNQDSPRKDNPTADDVAKLAKDAKSDDPEKAVPAQRELQRIGEQAKDPKVRQDAKDALKKADPNAPTNDPSGDDKNPNGSTGGDSKKPMGDKTGDKPMKGTGGQPGGDPNEKNEPGKTKNPGAKTDKPGDPMNPGDGTEGGKDPANPTKNNKPANGNPGDNAGGGSGPGDRPPEAGNQGGAEPAPKGSPADIENKKRAVDLQLEKLKNLVTPEMLKQANIPPEQRDQFFKSLKEMKHRQLQQEAEKYAPPQTGGTRLPSSFRAGEAPKGTAQDLTNAGQTAPPLELQNSYKEFTKKLAEPKPK